VFDRYGLRLSLELSAVLPVAFLNDSWSGFLSVSRRAEEKLEVTVYRSDASVLVLQSVVSES